eukprot:1029298-Rhodomonas_salina.2
MHDQAGSGYDALKRFRRLMLDLRVSDAHLSCIGARMTCPIAWTPASVRPAIAIAFGASLPAHPRQNIHIQKATTLKLCDAKHAASPHACPRRCACFAVERPAGGAQACQMRV